MSSGTSVSTLDDVSLFLEFDSLFLKVSIKLSLFLKFDYYKRKKLINSRPIFATVPTNSGYNQRFCRFGNSRNVLKYWIQGISYTTDKLAGPERYFISDVQGMPQYAR